MDLTAVFSNDQIAVMGCFLALTVCGLLAATSFRFGPAGKTAQRVENRTAGKIQPSDAASRRKSQEGRKAA